MLGFNTIGLIWYVSEFWLKEMCLCLKRKVLLKPYHCLQIMQKILETNQIALSFFVWGSAKAISKLISTLP